MEASPYEIAVIAGSFTIIGAVLGALIAYRFALKLHNINEFNEAAEKFRTAFVEAQRLLDESKAFDITAQDGDRVSDILKRHIIGHEKAMLTFRPYVPKWKLPSFDKAWKEYYSQENKYAESLSDYAPDHVTSSVVNPKYEEQKRKLALDRIERLLDFAPPG